MMVRYKLLLASLCVAALVASLGIVAFGQASGAPEGDVTSGTATTTAAAGDNNVVIDVLTISDAGGDGNDLLIEYICVARTAGSTLPDSAIVEIRLYQDSNGDGSLTDSGIDRDQLLGLIRNPVLDPAGPGSDPNCPGAKFGTEGNLLYLVEEGDSADFFVTITTSFAAQDGDTLQTFTTVKVRDGLTGAGPSHLSSQFVDGESTRVVLNVNTLTILNAGGGERDAIVTDETLATTAAPGETVVLQQFTIHDLGEDECGVYVDRITITATGSPDDAVLAGVKKLRLYRESGATPPGWQPGDTLLAVINNPNLAAGATFGARGGRVLTWIPSGSERRFYVVAELGYDFKDGDTILPAVEVATRDASPSASPDTCSSLIRTPKVTAGNLLTIELPQPLISIAGGGNINLMSPARVVVSVENIPYPGLDTIEGVLTFDPDVIQVAQDKQGNYRIMGIGPYRVDWDETNVDNDEGSVEFVVSLREGAERRAIRGSGEVFWIEFVPATGVQPGDWTAIEISEFEDETRPLLEDLDGNALEEAIVEPGRITIKVVWGDVSGDGRVTRKDARLVARYILGRFTPENEDLFRMVADVAKPCGIIDASDVRAIKEAAAGRRTLCGCFLPPEACWPVDGLSALGIVAPEPLTVGAISAYPNPLVRGQTLNFSVEGSGIAGIELQVFNLAGALVLEKAANGRSLTCEALGKDGRPLANGVFIYVVTVKGYDGTVLRSEVRKLVILR